MPGTAFFLDLLTAFFLDVFIFEVGTIDPTINCTMIHSTIEQQGPSRHS
jgi:hypothetical protein